MDLRQALSIPASKSGEILRSPRIAPHIERVSEAIHHPKDALPVPVKRFAMRRAGSAREAYWRTVHPFTFGAALAMTDVEVTEVALVRQSYGNSKLWQLPGGGIDKADKKVVKAMLLNGVHAEGLPKEHFINSALREGREELGVVVDADSVTHIGNYPNFDWSQQIVPANKDTLGIFHAPIVGFAEIEFDVQASELDAVERWSLGNILDRTVGTSNPDPNMAWYLGSVATKLLPMQDRAA